MFLVNVDLESICDELSRDVGVIVSVAFKIDHSDFTDVRADQSRFRIRVAFFHQQMPFCHGQPHFP